MSLKWLDCLIKCMIQMTETWHARHACAQDQDAARSQIPAQPPCQGQSQGGVKMVQHLTADDDIHGLAQGEGLENILAPEIDQLAHSGPQPD